MTRSFPTSTRLMQLSVAALCFGATCVEALSAEPDSRVRAIGEAYLANRESFSFFECRFTINAGYAANVEAAIARGPDRDVVSATCLWIRDGDVQRYEMNRDLRKSSPPEQVDGDRLVAVRLPPQAFLIGPEYALSVSGVSRAGSVGLLKDVYHHLPSTPWNMAGEAGEDGRLNLGDMIADYFGTPNVSFRLGPDSPHHPRLTRVDVMFTEDDVGTTFFVDERQGALPKEVWMVRAGGRVPRKVFIPTIAACSGNRFFPTRVVAVILDVAPPRSGVHVTDLRVTKLDADRRPAAADLMVSLPAGARLNDGATLGAQSALRAARKVAYADLASLASDLLQVAENRKAKGSLRTPVGPEPRTWRPWIIAGNALLILAVVGYLLWRRNR